MAPAPAGGNYAKDVLTCKLHGWCIGAVFLGSLFPRVMIVSHAWHYLGTRVLHTRLSSYGGARVIRFINIRSASTVVMKYLNVAEKNDAAKNIASQLSRGTSRRREGYSQYNKIYEFEDEVLGQRSTMVMTSVSGHLLAMEFVGAYKHWQSCNPLALFDAPVFKYCPENYQNIKKTLEREVRSCQGLIIWTDCDREGENIGFEIVQVCSAARNGLNIYRAKFSEITAVSVRRALANLERPDKNVSDAVDVRQELDLRIGAAFTRFQTLRLQRVFPAKLADSLVSYGSCQFPTLGFVVERYRAVESFVPERFWKIKVNHTIGELSVDFTWERGRLFDELACRVLHDLCVESPRATVADVKTKPKSKWRPLPLDTVELEKLASRKLKINAKETMRLAEKLYTQGFISYPRTETNEYPKEMDLAQLVTQQTADRSWGTFAQGILDGGGPNPRQGNKSDKAHPPIHPTKYTNGLAGNEQRLYEFIVRSFLACCSKDAQGQETSVSAELAGEKFSASGLMITARNYLDVYPYDKWSSKEIHVYERGQVFQPTSIDMVDGSTSAPNLLTEADLIALMEKHGIGTDATHADHIETIKSRSYVALADQIHFVPGLLGMGLVEGYDAMGLAVAKPDLRANLEADLKAISEGRKQPDVVLAEQIAKYKEVYVTVTAEALKIDNALAERFNERPNIYTPNADVIPTDSPPALKCPKCNMDMTLRLKKNSDEYFISCSSYPQCKNAIWFPNVVRTVEVLPEHCPHCGPNYRMLKFDWRNNSISHLYPPPYRACIGGCDTNFLEILKISLASVKSGVADTRNVNNPNTNGTANNMGNRPNANVNRPQNNNRNDPPIFPMQARTIQNTAPATNNQAPTRATNRIVPNQRASAPAADDNNVMCGCNQLAVLLTVRKQTANFGKKFYKCAVGKENGGCDFFLWAPENAEQPGVDTPPPSHAWGAPSAQPAPGPAGGGGGWGLTPSASGDTRRGGQDAGDDVVCNCNLPCKKLTVQKEGLNKGKLFYCCANDYNSRCNFFQWADSVPAVADWGSGGGNSGRGGGRGGRGARGGRGGGAGRAGGAAAAPRGGPRRCGHCRQEGHTRTRCPNLNN